MRFRASKPHPTIVPTTSVGDIAFLLMIFFLLCSVFARDSGKHVQPPQAPDLKQVKNPAVWVTIDEEGRIMVQTREVGGADQVQAHIEALIGDKKGEEQRRVLFRCHRTVNREVYEPVLDGIAKAGGVVIAVGDKVPAPR